MENELMKENEMSNAIQNIQVVQGSVIFGAYEELKRQATNLAEQIRTVEVSDDNVKQSKKLLASVNKRVKELEDKRISIKKMMLEPYMNFEEQVKEIVQIVKDADSHVRVQVKHLEEQERDQKHYALQDIFDKRKKMYSFGDLLDFTNHFLKQKYLNKTVTIDAVEKEMVDFLEQHQKDLQLIEKMDSSGALYTHYLNCLDLSSALTLWNEEKDRQVQIERNLKVVKLQPTESEIAFLVSVKVYNQKELKLLEMILKDNQFEYTTDKVVL